MSPSSVKIGRRLSSRNRTLPIESSSRFICSVIAGCVRPCLRAVSVTLPVSTIETNDRSTRTSRQNELMAGRSSSDAI